MFIHLADDLFDRWIADPLLQRNMQRSLKQVAEFDNAESSEHFWVLYWYRLWKNGPESLADGHLSAYLQEPCYWIAQRVAIQLTSMQYKFSDCFQIAIASLPIVLKGYNPAQGASLKTYASLVFNNTLRDTLRQQREAGSRTDWGLLRKISQKQLIDVATCNHNRSDLQSRHFSARIKCNYNCASARINCN